MTAAVIERIEADLGQQWSPEQIAGRLAATGGLRLSPQRIYQHIQADRQAGGTLYRYLATSEETQETLWKSRCPIRLTASVLTSDRPS